MNNSKTQFKGILMLLLTALIWGVSFVAQSEGMESVDAFTFMGIRTLLGSAVLVPVILVKDLVSYKKTPVENRSEFKAENKRLNLKTLLFGSILGVALCVATTFQQFAFYYSTAGKIAFITAMYMFFIPVVGLFFRKRVSLLTWFCVIMALVGLYFLCFATNGFGKINKGDILAIICSVFFTVQILLVEKFSPQVDGIKLSCVQFFVAGFIASVCMFIFEKPEWASIKKAALPILYSGIMSCGVAYTMQVIGQKYCEATIASLLMSLESVFAVIASAILIHERLTMWEIIGCVVMFSAILISQIGDIIKARKSTE